MFYRKGYDFSELSINELKNHITEIRGRVRSPYDIVMGSLYRIGGITAVSAILTPFSDNPKMIFTACLAGIAVERFYSAWLAIRDGYAELELAHAREEYYNRSEFLDDFKSF